MNITKRILGMLFIGLASTALFIACGDETACITETDCDGSEVCIAEVCRLKCTTAAECAEGEVCNTSAAQGYCEPGTDPNTTNNMTTNTNNTTTNVVTPVYVALIQDTTTGIGCDGDNPGSDLIYVALEADDGMIKGYGEAVYENYLGDDNVYTLGANLDGAAPGSLNSCPEFNDDNVTALGCGGSVGLRFLNAGTPVAIELGDQIRIYEFGGQCPTGTTVDAFDLILCSDTDAVVNDTDITSCTKNLAGGEGETVITITSTF